MRKSGGSQKRFKANKIKAFIVFIWSAAGSRAGFCAARRCFTTYSGSGDFQLNEKPAARLAPPVFRTL